MTDTPIEHSETARPAASKDDVANASPQADVLEGLLDEFRWAVRQFERAVPYELRYHREDVADCYTALITHVRAVERERDALRDEAAGLRKIYMERFKAQAEGTSRIDKHG